MKNAEKNTHKESVNKKIKSRTYLDVIEKRRIINLNLSNRSQPIYAYLIEKYIYFFNSNRLNSKGEFHQTYDDIILGIMSNLSYHLIKKVLDELTDKGFITRNLKVPEGVKSNIPKYHFTLNMEKLDDIIITAEEYKLPNNKKYEIQQNIKYENKTKVVSIVDELDKAPEPAVEPKNEHEEVIDEPINPTKEDNNNQLSEEEIMKINEEFREKVREEDFNERAKLLMKHKDLEGVKPVLKDLMLSFQTINYLYSSDYKEGDKNLDDKKATLDILYDMRIKQLLNK